MTGTGASLAQRLEALQRRFIARYGTGEVRFLSAPARINILGEHIDYVSYLATASLTFGSRPHAMLMAYRANVEGQVRGASTHTAYAPFTLALSEAAFAENTSWENYLIAQPTLPAHWSHYVAGAMRYAQWLHTGKVKHGIDFLIDSTIPACGGSSSSSALTCLTGAALREVNGVAFTAHDLALDSARAEWFVGTRGGAMDHQTICLSQPDAAVVIHHDTRETETVALPATGYAWVTFFSHEADKGSRVMLEYNARAAVSRIVIPALLSAFVVPPLGGGVRVQSPPPEGGTTNALPEFTTLAEFARDHEAAFGECERLFPQLVATRQHEALPVRAYAEHHAGEVRRVAQALDWLRAEPTISDDTMQKLGALLNETHASLRDLYGVSTAEVETLRDLVLCESSVYGARLMGGGFGGNVLALVREASMTALIETIQRNFYAPRGREALTEGAVMVSTPGAGLRTITL